MLDTKKTTKDNLIKNSLVITGLSLCFAMPLTGLAAGSLELNDEPAPYLDDDDLPARTGPIIEIGEKFLSTGNINKGFVLPTGAVWNPSLWVYGNYRTAVQSYRSNANEDETVTEWSNRLDLFANLQLSGTERILLGLTPLQNRDTGETSGKIFFPDSQERTVNETNLDIDTLFFEGDFSEIFPNLDRNDSSSNDIGFTIGRQNIQFMDGFMVNDNMDGIGFSKNNIRFDDTAGIVNLRSSFFYAWDEVNRSDNEEDKDAKLYGWFNQLDTIDSTYNLDLVYVDSDGKGDIINFGLDRTKRYGKFNSTLRAAFSQASDNVTDQANDGTLLFSELSWVPAHTNDNIYINGFWGFDQYTPAARGPAIGGPLGRAGLLFASPNLGTVPAPLNNSAQEAAGLVLGYQKIIGDGRRQFTVEVGARDSRDDEVADEAGIYGRFQQALGRRTILQFDMYGTDVEDGDEEYGARVELQVKL